MKQVTVVDCILCEDIRQELGGKFSVMGIYNDDLIVPGDPVWPMVLRHYVFVRLRNFPNQGTMNVTVSSGEETIVEAKVDIQVTGNGDIVAVPLPMHLQLKQFAKLVTRLSFTDASNENLGQYECSLVIREPRQGDVNLPAHLIPPQSS